MSTLSTGQSSAGRRTLVVCTSAQLDLARLVVQNARLDVVGVVSAEAASGRGDFAGLVASGAGWPVVEQLRGVIGRVEPDAVLALSAPTNGWMAGAAGVSGDDAAGLATLAANGRGTASRGVRVFSLEPMGSASSRSSSGNDDDGDAPGATETALAEAGVVLGPGGADDAPMSEPVAGGGFAQASLSKPTLVPLLRLSKPVRTAAEVISQLGLIRSIWIESLAGQAGAEGSLGARVLDACDACLWLMGSPDRVDAAFAPALKTRGVYMEPPADVAGLASLSGDVSVNLRFADGRCGGIVASDRAGRWQRTVTLVGEQGRLRIFDDGFVWYATDGRVIDSSRDDSRIRGASASDGPHKACAWAIAEQIDRALDPHIPPEPPVDEAGVYAIAGAVLLSARTGEGESPATMRRMARLS